MSQSASRKNPLLFLDGLRGLAALYVVVGHARMLLWEGYQEGYAKHPASYSWLNKLTMLFFTLFKNGHTAVLFFFVLSGFVIHLSYAKKLKASSEARFDWASFLYRRSRRIYPPFLLALVLTSALDFYGAYLRFPIYAQHTPYTVINNNVVPLHSFSVLIGNLAFLMWSLVPVWGTDGPLWSLHFEWWFYMLYPVFWRLSKKSIGLATVLLLLFFGLGFFQGVWARFFLSDVLTMMLSWWFGVLLADIYAKRIRAKFSYLAFLSFSALLLRFVSVKNSNVVDTLYALSFAGFLAFCFYLLEEGKSLKLLEHFKPLGDMSYTLYVTHFPILVFFSGWLMSQSPSKTLPTHFGWLVLGVVSVSVFACIFHLLVEKPFTKKRNIQTAVA